MMWCCCKPPGDRKDENSSASGQDVPQVLQENVHQDANELLELVYFIFCSPLKSFHSTDKLSFFNRISVISDEKKTNEILET